MGVVYHANYLIWFDRARTELMRETGVTYKELEQQGVYLAVSEVDVRFRAAARYDDLVRVRCWVRELASRRGTLGYVADRAAPGDLAPTREAALAAGRGGDRAAVTPLLAALRDSSAAVQAAAAFALGLLKDGRAVAPLAALTRTGDGAPQCEAVTALAKIGGDEGARAVANLLAVKTAPGAGTSAVQRVALLEAWRLGTRAPVAQLTDFARDPDPAARAHAVYSLARLEIAGAVPALLGALADREPYVRAVALRGVRRALSA